MPDIDDVSAESAVGGRGHAVCEANDSAYAKSVISRAMNISDRTSTSWPRASQSQTGRCADRL
jgi:hypothetical protein